MAFFPINTVPRSQNLPNLIYLKLLYLFKISDGMNWTSAPLASDFTLPPVYIHVSCTKVISILVLKPKKKNNLPVHT